MAICRPQLGIFSLEQPVLAAPFANGLVSPRVAVLDALGRSPGCDKLLWTSLGPSANLAAKSERGACFEALVRCPRPTSSR